MRNNSMDNFNHGHPERREGFRGQNDSFGREAADRRGSDCRGRGGCRNHKHMEDFRHEMHHHKDESFHDRHGSGCKSLHHGMHKHGFGAGCGRMDDERMGRHHGFHHDGHGRDEYGGFGFFREMGKRMDKQGKARRGETRYLILDAIRNGAVHGYEIIKNLEERSGGQYAPSPGSVYPILQYLEDLNFVQIHKEGDRRIYSITDEGMKELSANEDKIRLFWSRFEAPRFSPEAETEIRCMREDMHLLMEIVRDGVHQALRLDDIEALSRLRQIIGDCRESVKNELTAMLTADQAKHNRNEANDEEI